ncbi:MAG: DsbA family oxidoreductase [Solirubrobacteraceae bacterium]
MNVEIWSDVACPWCYLGKRRFAAALEGFEHRDDVTIRWRSFELDPQAPRERDVDAVTYLAGKYGMTPEEARARQEHLEGLAAADGLELHLDRSRGGNTFDAHRLLALAADRGLQDEAKERLMRAYHTDGEPIADHDVLARAATDAGLEPDEVADVLAGDRYADAVREDEHTAAQFGINGVPFFVVDRTMALSGAQTPQVLGELLRQAWERRPAPAISD